MLFHPHCQYLGSRNTVAWFYLFLHTVLRYFYYQHMSLYIFFTSFSSMPKASIVYAQYFNLVLSNWPTVPHETSKKLKNAQNSLREADCTSKKWSLWILSLARMEQFSFQIKSQQTCSRLRALKLCAIYSSHIWSFWQFREDQQFKTHWRDTIAELFSIESVCLMDYISNFLYLQLTPVLSNIIS